MLKRCFQMFCWVLLLANTAFAEYKKIVVVGAGLAGLTTAYRLQQLTGEPVEIYEARERVGGRVLTAYFQDSHEELGAKFICVTEPTNLKALVEEMGLEIESYSSAITNKKYDYKGKVAPYYSAFLNTPAPDESTYNLFRAWALEEKNLGALLNRFLAKQTIARHLSEIRMRGLEGNDSKDLSTEYMGNFWDYYNRSYLFGQGQIQNIAHHETIRGGNSALPEKLAEKLDGHIHFGQPLRKISMDNEGKYVLQFPDNRVVTTDYLVLTLPCSTLRDVKVERGIIPSDQWNAIKTLQYGTNGVVLMSVKMDNEDASEYSVTEDAVVWFNQDREILTLAFGGQSGIFKSKSSEEVNKKIKNELPALKRLFPSINYTGKHQAVSWLNEEFSKGSVSSWGVGHFKIFSLTMPLLGENVRKVFRPIENRVFFAGEHTSIDHPATMEGAVESGEVTARMIARVLKEKFIPTKEKETTGPGS